MGFAKFPLPRPEHRSHLVPGDFLLPHGLGEPPGADLFDGEPEEVQDCRSHAGEAGDSSELPFAIGDEGIAERKGPGPRSAGRCRQVVACLSRRTRSIPRLLRQGFKKAKPQVRRARPDAVRSVAGSVSSPAIEQLRSDHDAGANARLSNPANVLRYAAVRVADEVGSHVGVEQVTY